MGATPQSDPPMPLWRVAKKAAVYATRAPLILVGLTYLVFPAYLAASEWLRDSLGFNDAAVFTFWATAVHTTFYWGINSFFHAAGKYGWLDAYRMPRNPDMTNPPSLLVNTWKEAAIGQLIGPFVLYALASSGLLDFFPPGNFGPLPSAASLFGAYSLAKVFNATGFYFAHRLFHHPKLYARFHKQHHSYIGTVGWAAEYADPVEQIFANIIPTVGGVILAQTHPIVLHLWLAARTEQTYESHSGYAFFGHWLYRIGLTNSEHTAFHDFHHTVNKGNYSDEWLDALFGTDDAWRGQGSFQGYLARLKAKAS